MKGFKFGDWVVIDEIIQGQFIQLKKKGFATIDVNGDWLNCELSRIKKTETVYGDNFHGKFLNGLYD